jgi:hypothetical protein
MSIYLDLRLLKRKVNSDLEEKVYVVPRANGQATVKAIKLKGQQKS